MASDLVIQLKNAANELSQLFRTSQLAKSHHQFTLFIDLLTLAIENKQLPNDEFFQQTLKVILTAQEQGDYLYIADILEYELFKTKE